MPTLKMTPELKKAKKTLAAAKKVKDKADRVLAKVNRLFNKADNAHSAAVKDFFAAQHAVRSIESPESEDEPVALRRSC